MALPVRSAILTDGYFYEGDTFVFVDAKTSVDSTVNGYFYEGDIFGAYNVTTVVSVTVNVTGVAATSAIGSVIVATPTYAFPYGVTATGRVGSVGNIANASVEVTGVYATGETGSIPFWVPVDDAQSTIWVDIN